MGNLQKKPVIGILGGIGSGKSTAAIEFTKLGCKVIDADKIAHEMLEKPEIKKQVLAFFGKDILDSNGNINRGKLAKIAFYDNDKLTSLNNIVHPPVLTHIEQLMDSYNKKPEIKAIVLDMPLLLEVGWDNQCDRIIFIDCKQKTRLDRARKIGIFDENQLKIRENFQISLDNKTAVADNIIDNNSELSALTKQVAVVFSSIMKNK